MNIYFQKGNSRCVFWFLSENFGIQHSLSPEIGVHGFTTDNFSRSVSGGVNLSRFSVGMDLNDPASSNWSNTTSIRFEVGVTCLCYQGLLGISFHVLSPSTNYSSETQFVAEANCYLSCSMFVQLVMMAAPLAEIVMGFQWLAGT